MKSKYKFFTFWALFVSVFFLTFSKSYASEIEFSLYPNSGQIEYGRNFTVDVLIDTKGEDVVLARAVLKFDPNIVQLESAQRNEEIFCDWPTSEQLLDNDTGMVIATGFCQSGVDELYATTGEPEIFVRLTFKTLRDGPVELSWEYTGLDQPGNSVIIKDGSPPQNFLNSEPASGSYNIFLPKTPETGLSIFEDIPSTILFGGGIFFLAFAVNILLDPRRKYFSKSRTIVVYDDKE